MRRQCSRCLRPGACQYRRYPWLNPRLVPSRNNCPRKPSMARPETGEPLGSRAAANCSADVANGVLHRVVAGLEHVRNGGITTTFGANLLLQLQVIQVLIRVLGEHLLHVRIAPTNAAAQTRVERGRRR